MVYGKDLNEIASLLYPGILKALKRNPPIYKYNKHFYEVVGSSGDVYAVYAGISELNDLFIGCTCRAERTCYHEGEIFLYILATKCKVDIQLLRQFLIVNFDLQERDLLLEFIREVLEHLKHETPEKVLENCLLKVR